MNGCPLGFGKKAPENGPPSSSEVTYWDYIATDALLSLQAARISGGLHHHEEHLFILVHQVFELWFRQILRELASVRSFLLGQDPALHLTTAVSRLGRAEKILRHSLGIFGILETMHPSDFAEFRDHIGPASGFQSSQMREMEIAMGLADNERFKRDGKAYLESFDASHRARLESCMQETTLKDALYAYLIDRVKTPNDWEAVFLQHKEAMLRQQKQLWFSAHPERVDSAVALEMAPVRELLYVQQQQLTEEEIRSKKVRLACLFLETYREAGDPTTALQAQLIDGAIAFEEAFLLWRHYHARMVERQIGRRVGTGGSSGVNYLDSTTSYRVFTDLWGVRSAIARPSGFPPIHTL